MVITTVCMGMCAVYSMSVHVRIFLSPSNQVCTKFSMNHIQAMYKL